MEDRRLVARRRSALVALLVSAVASSLISPGSCLEQGIAPLNGACTCTGDQLRLSCTVAGSGVTVWRVSGLPADCQEITLRNDEFSSPEGVRRNRTCSGEFQNLVVGMSVSVDNDFYKSQLSLTAISPLDNTEILCLLNNGTVTTVGMYTVDLVTDPYPAPSDISLTDISSEGLTFSWTSVAPNCSSVLYSVNASDCGNCPVSTNLTFVVCSDVELSGDDRSCDIQVQTTTCGNLVSSYSDTVTTVLQAPDQPVATVVPRYQQDSAHLVSFSVAITQVDYVTISGHNVTTESYVLSYRTNDVVCDSGTVESADAACAQGVCRAGFSLSTSSTCSSPPVEDFTLSVSATSVLGTGSPSMMTIARSSDDFVRVLPNISDSSISCSFTDTQDTSLKTCSISYGPCGAEPSQTVQANSSTGDVNLVRVRLAVVDSASFCYVVTASNDTYIVEVEGTVAMTTTTTTTEPGGGGGGTAASGGLSGGAIAAIIVVLLIAAAVAVVVAVIVVVVVLRKRSGSRKLSDTSAHPDEEKELDTMDSSRVSDEPIVRPETESHPPGENDGGSSKDETATEKETVQNPTYSTTSTSAPLTVNNILHKLSDYPTKWQVMGEALSLSDRHVDEIYTNYDTDEACLRAMVERYLQLTTANHSWQEVDAALEKAKEVQNQEIEDRLKKHPDKVPVIIERRKGEEILKETVKTLWIPKKLTIAQLGAAIRKPTHLDLRQEQSLYLNIDGKTVHSGTLGDLYTTHRHVDGYLHITYSSLESS